MGEGTIRISPPARVQIMNNCDGTRLQCFGPFPGIFKVLGPLWMRFQGLGSNEIEQSYWMKAIHWTYGLR